ncbi:MAG TPA: acetyltransferase, partial [Campylobacter avium]|nr:acetyltransferase [Campylobacter avium]
MKDEILIIGAGGHALSCVDVIESEARFKIAGFVDNEANKTGLDYEILGNDDELKSLRKKYKFAFLAIGQTKSANPRIRLFEKLKSLDFIMPTIISPRAYISKYAQIDTEASIIMHNVLVNAGAKVGKACILNTNSLLEHGCVVEDFSHISTCAVVNGDCVVKRASFLGSNTNLKHGQILGENSIFYKDKF